MARFGVLTPNGCFSTSVWCAKFWLGVFIKKGDFSNIFKYKGENSKFHTFVVNCKNNLPNFHIISIKLVICMVMKNFFYVFGYKLLKLEKKMKFFEK